MPVYGHLIGPEKKGETRVLRNALIKETEDLVKDIDGMSDLKSILDKNAKDVPNKPIIGQRERIVNKENGEVTFGEY